HGPGAPAWWTPGTRRTHVGEPPGRRAAGSRPRTARVRAERHGRLHRLRHHRHAPAGAGGWRASHGGALLGDAPDEVDGGGGRGALADEARDLLMHGVVAVHVEGAAVVVTGDQSEIEGSRAAGEIEP